MYAVVEIAGKQFRLKEGLRLKVPKLDLDQGAQHSFGQVMLLGGGEEETQVGTPHIAGAAVKATVLGHGRDKKVIVFKMKRRKNYRRRNGHRQDFTEIQIDEITASSAN